ncbi:MAG: CoA transferase [Rhizobiales bacterium]|nr:CoA transferase [Hyphomicrobiales bacterium]MBI3674023.1 CoA transferase [Hyphomicrobiales bacterium]
MAGPLNGVIVVDLSRVLAGPWCTQMLADLGATVIKIERPGIGDDTRSWGPPFLADASGKPGDAAYYLACNRNKHSVTADISRAAGQRAVRELAARADVFIENYKVGGLARYGLDAASLRAVNPRLVHCSVTGFGQTGPYRELPGYDFMIQGLGGLMSVTGERDDRPGGGPQKVGIAVADLMTGMNAGIAILAALLHQRATGEGQAIDVALLDSQVAMMAVLNMNYFVSGKAPRRVGNAHQNIVPYDVFATADGHLIVTAGNDSQFTALCQAMGRADLSTDARFRDNRGRVTHRDILVPILAKEFLSHPSSWWLATLKAAGVPCGSINDIEQVWQDPQVIDRGMKIELPHPHAGSLPLVASPLRLSRTPVEYRRAPPLLGADTESVLSELLGWTDGEIAALMAEAGAPS